MSLPVSTPTASTPVVPKSRVITPANLGNPITGASGCRVLSAETMRVAGATQCARNNDGDNTPAQESNIISASAPATT
jgi:hypothetical protein